MTYHLREKTGRIIEKLIISALSMEMPEFPCYRVDISHSGESLVSRFIELRPNQNWLLLADYAAQSHQQLWTAWLLTRRAFLQKRALARSIDAEFLRYIAGTHHVSEAFRKVGINDTHKHAWIIYLPEYEIVEGEITPTNWSNETNEILDHLVTELSLRTAPGIPKLSIEGLKILGLEIDKLSELTNDSLVAHTISTDLNS